jgi:RES domain
VHTLYRHAMWDTPWWANPNRSAGRYNAPGDPPVQYWCTHPLGPAAEFMRWQGKLSAAELRDVRLRVWAARVPSDDLVRIDFDNSRSYGVEPDALVGEDYSPTQALAERLRANGTAGLLVPSAALPGTEVAVLFGPRLLFPYLLDPIDDEQVRTAHVADAFVPPEAVPHVCWKGSDHSALMDWQASGRSTPFVDPPVSR